MRSSFSYVGLELEEVIIENWNLILDYRLNNTALTELVSDYRELFDNRTEEEALGAPMLWIGIYIAAASLVCSLAMAIDVFRGFSHRKIWFPCKFFTLNAASLTLLAVAMKLPMDLTTQMPKEEDQLVKLSSAIFMCTAMGNFMPSLGTMGSNELLSNIVALGILVITMIVNICIQLNTGTIETDKDTTLEGGILLFAHVLVVCFMLVLLLLISSSALIVPASKNILQLKYEDKHKMASNEGSCQTGKFKVQKLKDNVKKYWMMVQSGGPQFVMATSATCAASGAICFLSALLLVIVETIVYSWEDTEWWAGASDYKQSTTLILLIQSLGVVVGTIPPTFRWLAAISFKRSKTGSNNYRNVFKIENYWIQKLVEWKGRSPLGLPIHARKCRKLVHDIKNTILHTCIGVQIAIAVASKTVRIIPIFFISMILSCCSFLKPLKRKLFPESSTSESESGNKELDLTRYVLQLEGEEELPKRVLKNISNSVDKLIHKARRQQPKNLMELLQKSARFKGVAEFDSNQVPRLQSDEPPNFWSLSVATLTSIAIALPNIKNDMVDRLLGSVSEGFVYTRIIEKNLDTKGDLVNLGNAADVLWLGVELYRKWLDEDLQKMALNGKTPEENLQRLGEISKNMVMEFNRNVNGGPEENPLNWPIEVITADSMYRIINTIVQDQTYENLFEQLSIMIADILGACLTNLPRIITMKCYCGDIKKSQGSVEEAARLLGETEEIMKILQRHELPSLDPDQAEDSISSSNIVTNSPGSSELHISVD